MNSTRAPSHSQHHHYSTFRSILSSAYAILTATIFLAFFTTNLLAAPTLFVSSAPNRSAATALQGAELTGPAYIFTSPDTGIAQVDFYLDAPPPAPIRQTERVAPFDFAGTAPNDTAYPFNTQSVGDGQHTVYARVRYSNASIEVVSAAFTINNSIPTFQFASDNLNFSVSTDNTAPQSKTVGLSVTGGNEQPFTLSKNASWLTATPPSGTTPATITITVNPASLAPGNYSDTVTVSGNSVITDTVDVTVSVVDPNASGLQPLQVSLNPSRTNAQVLQGSTQNGVIYVYLPDSGNIKQVKFYLDNPALSGSPLQTEGLPPYDMRGTAPNDTAYPLDTSTLTDGDHSVNVLVITKTGEQLPTSASFTIANDTATLNFSQGTLSSTRHIDNTAPIDHTVQLTTSDSSGAPFSISSDVSWLSASANSSTTPAIVTVTAAPSGLGVGTYTGILTATAPGLIDSKLNYTLTITNDAPGINVSPGSLTFSGEPNNPVSSKVVTIEHSLGEQIAFTVSTNMPWLSASPGSATTPAPVTVNVDSNGLATGSYSAIMTITPATSSAIDVPVTLNLSSQDQCAPVSCSDVRVSLPYQLSFTEGQGYYPDKNGWGTGFTWLAKPSAGTGYIANNLDMNFLQGTLKLTTTSGIAHLSNNSQDNMLGVGFAAPNQITHITGQLLDVPAGSGKYEQAGLWFGNDEDNYIKLVVLSDPSGLVIHYLMEVGGATVTQKNIPVPNLTGRDVTLSIKVNPYSRTTELGYRLDNGTNFQVATLTPPDEFFSFDAAGIDPQIGTRSFTGIFATHRHGSAPLTYIFDDFTMVEGGGPLPADSGIDFVRKSYAASYPTSMVWGPDDRLYVSELFGTIKALTFDAEMNLIQTDTINSLVNSVGPRLTLGLTVSPSSTSGNVELWVSHSSPSVDDGEPNSGTVTKLSGSGFSIVEHIITGLPRAKANHAVNSLHFGPDDNRLYIAVGGNTGAGAPNNSNSEFGQMQEQPLSAAILVADVFAANFDGSCNNASDIFGPPPCDVVTYATGLRNSYDFVFHSNGNMYATDNGLGVTGTYPPSPEPSCLGLSSTTSYLNGGHNPGSQPDLLHLISEGRYYGHPNPYRDECVFKDGSYQGVAPLPNYEAGFYNLGEHKSANAIIEYSGAQGCVGEALNGQLLITNYSIGDDIFRVLLNETGTGVIEGAPLVTGFNDPLPLTKSPNGTLFVGEFGGQKITVLQPLSLGCWDIPTPSPIPVLDAAAGSINGKIYMVGGKNSTGHLSSLFIYDVNSNVWTQGADLPGEAVENAASATLNGRLYVFGGSTGPFSGAVQNSAVYDPGTNSWTSLAPMLSARGGVTAQTVNGNIYVIGGMNNSGQSVATVEVYNPGSNTWHTITPLITRRDNAGSAVLGGQLYVFGGRVRNADGTTLNGSLKTVETFNLSTGTWSEVAEMPTGRRAMSVGVLNGKAQVIGGEQNPNGSSGVYEQNEEYDPTTNTWRALSKVPTPKHGAATATVDGSIYIIGGGVTTGSSYTSSVEAMRF